MVKEAAAKKASEGRSRELSALKVGKKLAPEKDKREAKPIRRMSLSVAKSPKKDLQIPEGEGEKLGDIAYVTEQLSKRTAADPALQALHRLAFNAPSRAMFLKKHLREFSGVVYDDDQTREKLVSRVESRPVNLLRDICSVVGLERGGSREELVERLVDWLEKPTEGKAKVTKKAASKKSNKRSSSDDEEEEEEEEEPKKKKSKTATKSKSKAKAPAKKTTKKASKDDAVKRPLSAYMYFVKERREEIAKKHPEEKITEIAKRLGESWRKLKEKEKAPFEEKAKKDKVRYEREKAKSK